MYEILIRRIQEAQLEKLNKEWMKKWLLQNSLEIDKRVEEEASREWEENLKKERQKSHSNVLSKKNDNNTILHRGVYLNLYNSWQIIPNENAIRENIEREYTEKFKKKIWPDYENVLNKRIIELDPHSVLMNLFDRHEWLKNGKPFALTRENDINERYLVYQFLQEFLQKKLSDFSPITKISSGELPEPNSLVWNTVDEQWLINYIEGYPLSQVRSFYCAHTCPDYFSYNLLSEGYFDGKEKLNYPPTRVDILRYLFDYDSAAMTAQKVQGIDCTTYAPFHITELKRLTNTQWGNLKIIFVNISREDKPIWIVLNKTNNNVWSAYVPSFFDRTDIISDVVPNVDIKQITYNNNDPALNDIKSLDKIAAWHAVLLGRIFPWCADDMSNPLDKYRENVPITLLHQYTRERFLLLPKNFSVLRMFHNRKPFSDKSVEQLLQNETLVGSLLGSENALDYLNTWQILQRFDKDELKISNDYRMLSVAERQPKYNDDME